MENLSMCRICLTENLNLRVVVGTYLQEMYQSLTYMPLDTRDFRPTGICYICLARLKNCYQLRKDALHSERLFAQMLNSNARSPSQLGVAPCTSRLSIKQTTLLSIGHIPQYDTMVEVKLEPPEPCDDIEIQLEHEEVMVETPLKEDSLKTEAWYEFEVEPAFPAVKEEIEDIARSGTDFEYESGTSGPTTRKKLVTEIVHKNCVTIHSKHNFKPIETESTDNEYQGSPLQKNNDNAMEHDSNQKETDDEDPVIDHVETPRQIIAVWMSAAAKTSAERSKEYRARRAMLKQQRESDAFVEIATECIGSAGPSEDDEIPGPSEIRIIEKRAKSAEATRRWREKKRADSGLSKQPAKTAAQRMREYRQRKKIALKVQPPLNTHITDKCNYASAYYEDITSDNLTRGDPKDTPREPNQDKLFDINPTSGTSYSSRSDPFMYNVDENGFTEESTLDNHLREKPFHCQICNKSFHVKSYLDIHYRTHTGEKPFQCDVCEKRFSGKTTLQRHQLTHTGEKSFQCHLCKKFFKRKVNLQRHLRTHTGEKPFQCQVCEKYFSEKSKLLTHNRSHTGEKPFQCQVCEKCFVVKSHLVAHRRTHTGEKTFQCNVCQKFFSRKGMLHIHLRIHTGEKPFQCHICNKSFSIKSSFQRHQLIHTGEKPFQCHLCKKCFKEKDGIRKHMFMHNGEKSFECHVCKKIFRHKINLQKHLRNNICEKTS